MSFGLLRCGMVHSFPKDHRISANGNIVGMEILDASKRMENPMAVAYAVAG